MGQMASKLENSRLNDKLLDFDNLQTMEKTLDLVKSQKGEENESLKTLNMELAEKVKKLEAMKSESLGSLSNLSGEAVQATQPVSMSPKVKSKKHRPNRKRQRNKK